MLYLIIASLVWAFSFGLIKGSLAEFDPLAVSFLRLLISTLVFLPWLRLGRPKVAGWAMLLGVVQFGFMYELYIASFAYLPAYGVALFTIFTPIYVVLIDSLLSRRWPLRNIVAALLAIAGALLIVGRMFAASEALKGIALLQGSNLCFALGQILFPKLARRGVGPAPLVAWMYVGAALLTGVTSWAFADPNRIAFGPEALWVLLYLGILPTGIGFFLWNKGATKTTAGRLGAANNLKVPLAVLVSWWVFGESAPYARVLLGLAVIGVALFLAQAKRDTAGR